jgi:nitric oxide reductase subunit B
MLLLCLFFGVIASFAFLYPELYNKFLPFYQLRPMHVSAALFWIISAAVAGIMVFREEVFNIRGRETVNERLFIYPWIGTVFLIFVFYAMKKFGGREYWEFPPFLCIPILTSWIILMVVYFKRMWPKEKKAPVYVWMWGTGLIFFLFTFLEQNLYQIPWFRQSFLREVAVQWKSNGAMVGAWNQMIYGSALYIMVKISGDEKAARSKKTIFFYFLGLTNLMFNWGHHIYNLPAASWIRHVSYAISMTELIFFINIVYTFKQKLSDQRKYRHLLTYRFLSAAEYWGLLNIILVLFISVPAINRYTHGTHITVAHAMGATIGINTMILLATLGYILKIDALPARNKSAMRVGMVVAHAGLFAFWISLIVAGVIKGYRDVALGIDNFQEMMKPVMTTFKVFSFAGVVLFCGMTAIVWNYFIALKRAKGLHSLRKHQLRDEPEQEHYLKRAPQAIGIKYEQPHQEKP